MVSSTDISELAAGHPLLWLNATLAQQAPPCGIDSADMLNAQSRLQRFAPLLMLLFPELHASGGRIESPLIETPGLQAALGIGPEFGRLWVKADHLLPIAGSIKARGGFHEVLEFAEKLAVDHGLLDTAGSYAQLAEASARELFGHYEIAVGSTGNLGLSIGVMAAALGFRATVHMSSDAKEWKKARLRDRGVRVVEHAGDYEQAVAAGRRQAKQDPFIYFVDDERSLSLLLGYSAAVPHLQKQLTAHGIVVDAGHPLFVYLPCGVGGAPGGIAFGLKQVFGPFVHCFFAEPVQSPCFMLHMMDGPGAARSAYDIGLSNNTEADGLAVPRASELSAALMRPLLSGVYTVDDAQLLRHLYLAQREEDIRIEPSAAAGLSGPGMLCHGERGQSYLAHHGLLPMMPQATHIAWTTGGLFVPPEQYREFHERGAALAA